MMGMHRLCDSCCEPHWSGRADDLTGGWICVGCDAETPESIDPEAAAEALAYLRNLVSGEVSP
jgi:hypothetical protein